MLFIIKQFCRLQKDALYGFVSRGLQKTAKDSITSDY